MHQIFENNTVQVGTRYDAGVCRVVDNRQLTDDHFSPLMQLKAMEKRLIKDKEPSRKVNQHHKFFFFKKRSSS